MHDPGCQVTPNVTVFRILRVAISICDAAPASVIQHSPLVLPPAIPRAGTALACVHSFGYLEKLMRTRLPWHAHFPHCVFCGNEVYIIELSSS